VNLKFAIVASKKTQRVIARAAEMDETLLSHIVRGRAVATQEERLRLARVLHQPVARLFPKPPKSDDVEAAS
jgi:transcriptional regulator with XRE-family HTH domain